MIFPEASTIVRQCSHLASTPTTPFPNIQFFGPSSGSCPVPPDPGRAENGCVPPGQTADRKDQTRSEFSKQFRIRPLDVRQFAAKQQKNTIRILRVNSLPCSPSPFFIPWKRADVLGPILGDLIRTECVLPSHYARHSCYAARISLPMNGPGIAPKGKSNQATYPNRKNCQQDFTHESPF